MTRRLVLSAVIAGLVMFAWQTVANLVMPWTSRAVGAVSDEEAARVAVLSVTPESGAYFVPYDEAAAVPGQPTVFLAVQRDGSLPFTRAVAGQIAANILALLLVAVLLRRLALKRFSSRVGAIAVVGLIGWIVGSLPHYLWWGFSRAFVGVELLNTALGWVLAGVILALGVRPPFGGPGLDSRPVG